MSTATARPPVAYMARTKRNYEAQGEEFIDGAKAFAEKRPPNWKGR